MKKYIIPSIGFLIGLSLIIGGFVANKPPIKQPVSVEYFKDGQILLPDMVCSDTLIVRDAAGLNSAFTYVEQDISWGSDADIDSLIHIYCIIK